MSLKTFKSYTKSTRGTVLVNRKDIWKGKPVKSLTFGKTSTGGRNNLGRITSRSKGAGHKNKHRLVDFYRKKDDLTAKVERIEYDPNRSAFLALLKYSDGIKNYILAPDKIKVGDEITDETAQEALRILFSTGFFNDVQLKRDRNTLIVVVSERPSVASIEFFGNKDIGDEEIDIMARWLPNEDWGEKWKRGLGPKRISESIVVCPSWVQFNPKPDDIVITIDPGMAFGTAEHGTTRACLRLLSEVVKVDDRILDIGSGSGILAIAAAGLGASETIAIEGDPVSFQALQSNAEKNGFSRQIRCVEEWAKAESLYALGPVDGIVANIETGVLSQLLPGIRDALTEGGWLILSGILSTQWPHFAAKVKVRGFRCLEVDRDGEWTSGLFART